MSDYFDLAQNYEESEREFRLALREAEKPTILNLSGYCEDCNDTISPERLAANPTATRCIDCQREYELLSKRYG